MSGLGNHSLQSKPILPPKHQRMRGARRARQKKSPESLLRSVRTPITSVWNSLDQQIPHFSSVGSLDNKVFNFVQMKNLTTVLTGSVSVPTFYAVSFNASTHINQWTSFNAIFDQYRIMGIEAWIIPGMTGTTTTNNQTQSLYSVTDYDDASTPSSTDNLLQFTNVIVSPSTNGHYRKWRPHIAVASYSGAFTSFANKPSDWIDVASGSVQHYGLKVGLDAGVAINVQLYVRIHIQFRNVF